MGFNDIFVGNKTGNVSVKVQCTGCQRITVVKIPSGKSFDKWNEKAKCTLCGAKKCWEKFES
jgi:hypothetical protein